ncbi:MAG: hypothetical protein ACKOEW_01065 [Methylocystis sp.]
MPIGHSFGAQVDLGAGAYGNSALGGAAGHLFWRDPDKGLVGVYGNGLLRGSKVSTGIWTAAGEFEGYFGKFTTSAVLGVQGLNASTAGMNQWEALALGGPDTFKVPNYFTDIVSVKYYPIDDLALSVGHIYTFGRNAITGEAEYLLPQFRGGPIAPSGYISAGYGFNAGSTVMAGLRAYFGEHDKTLIRRHREDDPFTYQNTNYGYITQKFGEFYMQQSGNGGRGGLLVGNGGSAGFTAP